MSRGVMAVTTDGRITCCVAPPELRGIGRCNHIEHQKEGEGPIQFVTRVNELINQDLFKQPQQQDQTEQRTNKYTGSIRPISRRSINQLLQTEDKDIVLEEIEVMRDYAVYVLTYERDIQVLKNDIPNYGDAWYRQKVMEMDQNRRNKHNCAISSISVLNRLAEIHGIDPVYPEDPKQHHRQEVAESILDYFKYELSYLRSM